MIFNLWRPYKWFKPKKDGWYLCTAAHGGGLNTPKVMELYFTDTACHYTDDPQAFILPRLPFLFRSRNRIWKNDRRTQRMDPGSAELPASSHDLFPGRILTGVLRYLPCQQLYASNHPDRYLPSRSVRYCKKEL